GSIGAAVDVEVSRQSPSPLLRQLRAILESASGLVVLGAPPEQVHNLLTAEGGPARAEWFDLIVIDEASQMDVAHAILPLCGIAAGGTVVLAGDPLQLPPIHQAAAPRGLEAVVGPVYTFFTGLHRVEPVMLEDNYRSNATLVE